MDMTREDEIARLQMEIHHNPRSPQFIKLAEIYLERGMAQEAYNLVKQSLKFHPRSVSGQILLGRILKQRKEFFESLTPLTEATKLAFDNWRAWLELGESYIELKNSKKALEAFKKVMLFNPTHPFARRAVAKLEVLTADEYEDDLFQMQKLPDTQFSESVAKPPENTWPAPDAKLTRQLSFIDALIVRNDTEKASRLLNECTTIYGNHPEIETRRLKLSVFEKPDFLQPKHRAEKSLAKMELIHHRKISALQLLLRRIESKKIEILST